MSDVVKKEYNCDYQTEIVCPYCGKVVSDSWEYREGVEPNQDTEIQCPNCDEDFFFSFDVSVTYSSY